MKLSVLIPVYNVEAYLDECVRSVLDQTHGDFEIILVDDGSTDTSGMICDRWASREPERIRVIHKENEGVLIARRRAMTQARGDALIFLDSDDCLRRDALERIDGAFRTHQCDIVMYNYTPDPAYQATCVCVPFEDDACIDKERLYELMCTSSALNAMCMRAVRRELTDGLPDYGAFSHVTNGEDLLCSLPLVTAAQRIVYLNQNLYYYRQRASSAVHTFRLGRINSIKTVHQELERYIDLWQMPRLHPGHYAREVRGWMDCVEGLLSSRKAMGHRHCMDQLQAMAADSYFRNAYEKMDGSLPKKQKILSQCLYKRRFWLLLLLRNMIRMAAIRRGKNRP